MRARRVVLYPLWRRKHLGKKSFRQWTVAGRGFAAPSFEVQPILSVTDCRESSQPSGRGGHHLGMRGNQAQVAAAKWLYL